MLLATLFAMPVSTTHAVVGAVLGMTVAGAGGACVRWGYPGLLTIVASWFASPLLAGLLSAAMHLAIQKGVFKVHARPLALHSEVALQPHRCSHRFRCSSTQQCCMMQRQLNPREAAYR